MAAPTVGVVKSRGAGNVQVFPMNNGTTLGSQDGSDIVTTLETAQPRGVNANTYVEAFGKRFICHRDAIRERDQGGAGTWGAVHTLANVPANGGSAHSGIHLMHPAGVPTLVMLYYDTTTNHVHLVSSIDGSSWAEAQVSTSSYTAGIRSGESLIFRNSIFWVLRFDSNNYHIVEHNLVTGVFKAYDVGPGEEPLDATHTHSLVMHDHKLFMLGRGGATGSATLWRLDGVRLVWAVSWSTAPGNRVELLDGNRPCVFSDGSNLICIMHDVTGTSPGTGDRAFRVANPTTLIHALGTDANVTEITNPLVPAQYRSGGVSAGQCSWSKYVDTITTPGSPVTFLWRNAGASPDGGTFDSFEYVNDSTVLTSHGSGISAAEFILPCVADGGADRQPVRTAPRPELEGPPVEVLGGYTKWYFRVYGTGAVIKTSLFFDGEEEAPGSLATLVGGSLVIESGTPATTPVIVGNQITNITPDSGVALYSFQTNTDSDGVAEGQGYNLYMAIVP